MTKSFYKNYIILLLALTFLRTISFEGMLTASLAMICAILIEIECNKK